MTHMPAGRTDGYTWPELYPLVLATLKARLSVLLRGHPGVGKSTMAARMAEALGLPLVDIRLAQCDPTDLCGVWFPDREARQLVSYPPSWAVQAAERPVFLFLDEINAGVSRPLQAAAYQIVLERRVGQVRLHPDTVILAAGNLETDEAIVTRLSSALSNRFVHFTLRPDADTWLAWAREANVEASVVAYIEKLGVAALYAPMGDEPAFPTPRSWTMASTLLRALPEVEHRRAVSACIGVRAAEQFFEWRRLFMQVDIDAILRRGKAIDFTRPQFSDPSFICAVTKAVAEVAARGEQLNEDELPNLVKFATSPGMDPEYVILLLRGLGRSPELFRALRRFPEFRALAARLVNLQPIIAEAAA